MVAEIAQTIRHACSVNHISPLRIKLQIKEFACHVPPFARLVCQVQVVKEYAKLARTNSTLLMVDHNVY